MFVTNTQKFFLTLLFIPLVFHGQIFKTASGNLEAISGVQRYNVVFEYAKNLKIPKHPSEKVFLEMESVKRNKENAGSGDIFKKNWFAYRKSIFEPKFIQEFNFFNLKEKQVTVAQNISDAAYTMVVKTLLIAPGNSNFVFKKEARIEAVVKIYKTQNKHTTLYSTETISVRSEGAKTDDLERIMSAYGELGRALSKHFSRKT